jgi:hypothetical protein
VLGLSTQEFLELTPAEYNILLVGYNRKQDEKTKRARLLAYWIGACVRCGMGKDYPDFDEIFPEPGEEVELSDEELVAECQAKGIRPPD